MKLSETEARSHICHVSMNRTYDDRQLCIGSDCMAWQRVVQVEHRPGGITEQFIVGYCGLVHAQTP